MASSRHWRISVGTRTAGKVGPVVRREGDPGEVAGDGRVGAAEAVRQLVAQLRPVGVAHDDRSHRAGPAEIVAVERLEQTIDVCAGEAPDVVAVVDVARGRADQHEPAEPLRLLAGREDPDHRAHGVAHEDDVLEVKGTADLQDVVGVAPQVGVSVRVERRQVGPAGSHVVEEDDPMGVLEGRGDEAPHVLVAAEPVREQHGRAVGPARHDHVVAGECVHRPTLARVSRSRLYAANRRRPASAA